MQDAKGRAVLLIVTHRGKHTMVRFLVDRGSQVDHDGLAALHRAAGNGGVAITSLLVD